MFGVVLWCDTQDQKAVIWCEDHGDLAFYRHSGSGADINLDAGDWVQFDLTLDRHLRLAHNPRLVSEGLYPDLANALQPSKPLAAQNRSSAKIIPFLMRKTQDGRDAAKPQQTSRIG